MWSLAEVWKTSAVAVRSAVEDFEGTTLEAVPGLLGKLHYLARLHDGLGKYRHWGMERVHGAEAAARAIHSSHMSVLTRVLRAPLRVLVEDASRSASGLQISNRELIHSLKTMPRQLFPERSQAVSQKHLMATLNALSALVESRGHASRQAASPLPPLDR
jgi:hypothetical protein